MNQTTTVGIDLDSLQAIEHAARICESYCACDNGEDDEDINRILRNRAAQIRDLARRAEPSVTDDAIPKSAVLVHGVWHVPLHLTQQPSVTAGDERALFEAWHRSKFATKHCTGQPTRDMHNGIYAEEYGPKHQQQMWEAWQARAALASPAVSQKDGAAVEVQLAILSLPITRDFDGRAMLDRASVECLLMGWPLVATPTATTARASIDVAALRDAYEAGTGHDRAPAPSRDAGNLSGLAQSLRFERDCPHCQKTFKDAECEVAANTLEALSQQGASQAPIPVGVCWSEQRCDFVHAETLASMGSAFYGEWRDRADEFPDRAAARAALARAPLPAQGEPIAKISESELRDVQSGRMGVPIRSAEWRKDQTIPLYLAAPAQPPLPAQDQLRKERDGWKEEAEARAETIALLREKLDLRTLHDKNEVWFWQGDGTDYPESMSNSMAVVIRADQLKAILAAPAQAGDARDAARYRWLAGADVESHSTRWSRWKLEYWDGFHGGWSPLVGTELDAAIDAAMSASQGQTGEVK